MDSEKISGIYCIENIKNHKKYIGQSVDIINRWRNHKWSLKSNKHPNNYLQASWNKYGENNFIFYILEKTLFLNEQEEYWINKLDTYNNGYNLTIGGDSVTEKFKKKVYMYNVDGAFIKEFDSLSLAAEYVNGSITTITSCCNHILNTAYGYIWSFDEKFDVMKQQLAPQNLHRKLQIHKYDSDGNYICSYKNAKEAKEQNNINPNSTKITQCCNGKGKSAYGFHWSYTKKDKIYVDNYKSKIKFKNRKIFKYDLNGTLIEIYDCCEKLEDDFSKQQIANIITCCVKNKDCNIKNPSISHGFIWSFDYKTFNIEDNLSKKAKNKTVYKYDLKGILIDQYNSISEINVSHKEKSAIEMCLSGHSKQSGGYIWSYNSSIEVPNQNFSFKKIPVYQYDKNGNFIKKYESMRDAQIDIKNNNICACCKGKRKTAGGYIWSYKYYNTLNDLLNRENDLKI